MTTITYEQLKRSFSQQFSEKHWKLTQELLYKWLKEGGSGVQRPIRAFVTALQSRLKTDGKVWEAWQVDKRYYALISLGNSNVWQVIRDDNALVCEGSGVDGDRLIHLQFLYIGRRFHVFAVDQRGSINYLIYNKSFEVLHSALRYAHEGGQRETIKHVIPIYSNDRHENISYLWAIYESKIILLYVSDNQMLKSVVYYSVPTKSKLIQAEGRDTIHFHNGLLALHYSSTMKDLQLEILDSTPAILFNEKPHTERRRTFESLKFPLTIDAVFHNQYNTSSEEIIHSFVTSVIPDTCPNYSSTGESISNLPFSIKCYVAGSRNSISLLTYQSSEFTVKSTIIQLTGRHLLDFELMNRNERLISIEPIQIIEYYTSDGHRHQRNLVDSMLGGKEEGNSRSGRKVAIWEACALLQLCIPVRRTWLQDLWKDAEYDLVTPSSSHTLQKTAIDQCLLLEGVLGLGLTKVLEEAILKTTNTAAIQEISHHYFLEESQKLFNWIGGQGLLTDGKLPSLRQHLHSLLFPLLTDRIFVYLMKKDHHHSDVNRGYYQQIPLTVSLDVTNVSQLIRTHSILSKALYDRKISFITETLKLTDTSILPTSTLLTDDLESNAMVELMLIHYESIIFRELISFYQLLCEDSLFRLSYFHTTGSKDSSLILRERVMKMFAKSPLVDELPEDELTGDCLLFELVDRSGGASYETKVKQWFEGLSQPFGHRSGSEIEQQLLLIFALPSLIFQQTSHKIINDLLYYKKTLVEMQQFLDQQKLVIKYILLYFTFFIRSLGTEKVQATKSREDALFFAQLATVFSMSSQEVEIIDALQQVDSYDGAKDLSRAIQVLQVSSSVKFLTQYSLIEPVVKRLLFSGQFQSSYTFLQALLSQNHPFMQSKRGVVAYGLSIPSLQTWELHWQQTRSLCDQLPPADALEGISQVTFFLCKWCIRIKSPTFQPLGSLLSKDLNFAESEQVIKFLFDYANRDIEQRAAPSPAVDTLFGFFVKLMRIEEAKALHDLHATATKHADSAEALQSFTYRTKILQLSTLCPRLSPIDYQLILNMNRINLIQ